MQLRYTDIASCNIFLYSRPYRGLYDGMVPSICPSVNTSVRAIWVHSLHADIRACIFYGSFTRQLRSFYFNNAFERVIVLRPLVTAHVSNSMFLAFVHVTNCFYDYNFMITINAEWKLIGTANLEELFSLVCATEIPIFRQKGESSRSRGLLSLHYTCSLHCCV